MANQAAEGKRTEEPAVSPGNLARAEKALEKLEASR